MFAMRPRNLFSLPSARPGGLPRLALLVAMCCALLACDDAPKSSPATPPPGPSKPRPRPPGPPKKKAKTAETRPELTDADFVESESNRDPFRSFMTDKGTKKPKGPVDTRKIILARYGLDELRLIAVVSGKAVRPRAMFRDPAGLGVTVRRGDRISKSSAKVKRILRSSVVVEVEEQTEDTQTAAEHVIELHPKEQRKPTVTGGLGSGPDSSSSEEQGGTPE